MKGAALDVTIEVEQASNGRGSGRLVAEALADVAVASRETERFKLSWPPGPPGCRGTTLLRACPRRL